MDKEKLKNELSEYFNHEAETLEPKAEWWQEAIFRASAHEQRSSGCGFDNRKHPKRTGLIERIKHMFEPLSLRKRTLPVKLSVYIALTLLFLGLSAGIGIVMANMGNNENPPVVEPDELAIVINGLAQGEKAFLHLGTHTDRLEIEHLLETRQVQHDCTILMEEFITGLEDGYYLLMLDAPGHYFRDPKGYTFMVQDSVIVNPNGRMFDFKLEQTPDYMFIETVVAFSGFSKDPIPLPSLPLWQRLLQPAAIIGAAIIVITLVILVWHRRLKAHR